MQYGPAPFDHASADEGDLAAGTAQFWVFECLCGIRTRTYLDNILVVV